MVTLFHVTSADGYIARKDGSEDFIPDDLWADFLEHCRENDAVVWGRNSYERAQGYGEELLKPFEELPIQRIILSRDLNFKTKPGYIVMHSPEEAVSTNRNTLVSTGPELNSWFLKNGLLDKVITVVLPESIGDGIRQFDFDTQDLLILTTETDGLSGRKTRFYDVST